MSGSVKESRPRRRKCHGPGRPSLWLAASIVVLMLPWTMQADEGADARHWTVCPADDSRPDCEFRGYGGLQEAVDRARSADVVIIRAGRYSPARYREVQHGHLTIRGAVVVEQKSISLLGEPGAILDGSEGVPSCAILVHDGAARISGFEIRNFRADRSDDDVYDGHGVFAVDGKVEVLNSTFQRIEKMSVSLLGRSAGDITRVRILDGHVGVWVDESASLNLRNSLIRNNDSAGVAAYADSTGRILNSVIEANLDDGVYADDSARLDLRNSVLLGNRPYAVRAEKAGKIDVDYLLLHGNEEAFFAGDSGAQVQVGGHVYFVDPKLDPQYRSDPAISSDRGDPSILDRDSTVSDIGLYGGPDAPDVP